MGLSICDSPVAGFARSLMNHQQSRIGLAFKAVVGCSNPILENRGPSEPVFRHQMVLSADTP